MGRECREGIEPDCLLCSGDYPAEFIETITSSSATIGIEMSPEAFREWLMEEVRNPEPDMLRGQLLGI